MLFQKNTIDAIQWAKLHKKADQVLFKSTREILNDLNWIRHIVLAKANGRFNIPSLRHDTVFNTFLFFPFNLDSVAVRTNIDALHKFFRDETIELEACPTCYRNDEPDWFIALCEPYHDLVWARLHGYPYWPAKQLAMNDNKVHVQFFGKHDFALIPEKNVCPFSGRNPVQIILEKDKKEFNDSLKVSLPDSFSHSRSINPLNHFLF